MRTHRWYTQKLENESCSLKSLKKEVFGKKKTAKKRSFSDSWVVYKITNSENGRFYIGSSTNVQKRYASHIKDLSEIKHHSYKFQNDWLKYDKSCFTLSIIWRPKEKITESELRAVEKSFIRSQKPYYNVVID